METFLQRLIDLDEVSGALLVGKDGLIVAGTLGSEDEELLGAISAAVLGSITDYTARINNGEMRYMIVETKTGTVHLADASGLILVVTTNTSGNMGRIRWEMQKACHHVSQLVASF